MKARDFLPQLSPEDQDLVSLGISCWSEPPSVADDLFLWAVMAEHRDATAAMRAVPGGYFLVCLCWFGVDQSSPHLFTIKGKAARGMVSELARQLDLLKRAGL